MELAQNRDQWRVLVLSVFCYQSVSKMDLREMGCEDGRCMELAEFGRLSF
jgi:hypothetical protein